MSTGNTSKYLKYAIGEIFLVVIGILIALQLNNWNESNKNAKRETVYLGKLVGNLKDDIALYEQIMRQDTIAMNGLRIISEVLSNPEETNIGKIKLNIAQLMAGTKFIPNRTTFDNLISSGQIELLKDDELVEQIFLYYRSVEEIENGIDDALISYNRNTFGPFIMEFGSFSDTDADLPKYRNENMMVNAVTFKLQLLGGQQNRYALQIARAEELIGEIESELTDD